MHHFRVLLPEGTAASREAIQLCLDQLDLDSDGHQVGRTMVSIPLFLFKVLTVKQPFSVLIRLRWQLHHVASLEIFQ